MVAEYLMIDVAVAVLSYILDKTFRLQILTRIKPLVFATIPTFIVFMLVDTYGTWRGFWTFGKSFMFTSVFGFPLIEEALLFLIAPYAAITMWNASLKLFKKVTS